MKRILLAGVLLGTAVNANAADLPARMYTKAPAMAVVYDWTGFYIGVNAGYGVGRSRTIQNFPGSSFDTFYQQERGGLAGGQIGYNWQTNMGLLGPVLFGVEADIQGADMRDSRTSLNGAAGIVSTYDKRLDWFGTVRGRVGLVAGSTVSYVTAGYAYGNSRDSVTQTPVGGAPGTFTFDGGRSGYVLGSGVEAALGGNWTGKIEYLYLDLGRRTEAFAGPQTLETRTRENIFRAGLNYRFGGNATLSAIPAANWGGFYLGGNVGTTNAQDRSTLISGALVERFNLAPDGYNGGVQAGYNWQASNWVFGIEADIQGAYARDNKTCVLTCSVLLASSYDARLPWFGTARGRIGYSVGSTLFYVTGGYAYGEVKTRVTTSSAFLLAPQTDTFSQGKSGYAVGGGIETPFSLLGLFGPNWTTKTEYLYVDLGSRMNNFAVGAAPFTLDTRVNQHIFRTGLNYHFNSPVVARY